LKRLIALLLIVLATATAYAIVEGQRIELLSVRNSVTSNIEDTTAAITADTVVGDGKFVPLFTYYAIMMRCTSVSDADSTYAWVAVRSRNGTSGSWAIVCSTSFMAAGEVWKHIHLGAKADTTLALGSHVGDEWRVDYILGDSTSNAIQETAWGFDVFVNGRY